MKIVSKFILSDQFNLPKTTIEEYAFDAAIRRGDMEGFIPHSIRIVGEHLDGLYRNYEIEVTGEEYEVSF
jgi:hypothetical protein